MVILDSMHATKTGDESIELPILDELIGRQLMSAVDE